MSGRRTSLASLVGYGRSKPGKPKAKPKHKSSSMKRKSKKVKPVSSAHVLQIPSGWGLSKIVAPLLRRIEHLETKSRLEVQDYVYAQHVQAMDLVPPGYALVDPDDEDSDSSSSSSESDSDSESPHQRRTTSTPKTSSTPSTTTHQDSKEVPVTVKEASECCVCLSSKSTHAIVPCMHVCLCEGCASKMAGRTVGKKCPKCRARCTSINKLYF